MRVNIGGLQAALAMFGMVVAGGLYANKDKIGSFVGAACSAIWDVD